MVTGRSRHQRQKYRAECRRTPEPSNWHERAEAEGYRHQLTLFFSCTMYKHTLFFFHHFFFGKIIGMPISFIYLDDWENVQAAVERNKEIKNSFTKQTCLVHDQATRQELVLVPNARAGHGAHQPRGPATRREAPRHHSRLLHGHATATVTGAGCRWYSEHQVALEVHHLVAAFLFDRQQPAAIAWREAREEQAQGKARPHEPQGCVAATATSAA